jgi:hypothetical protein
MKCIYCQKEHDLNTLGGLVYISCCNKSQIIKQSVRPLALKAFQENQGVVLIDDPEEFLSFILRTNVL